MPKWQKIVIGVLLIILAIVLVDRYYPGAIPTEISKKQLSEIKEQDGTYLAFPSGTETRKNDNILTTTGIIKNISQKPVSNVTVTFFCFDEKGEEIGNIQKKIANTLQPNETAEFTIDYEIPAGREYKKGAVTAYSI